MNHYETGSKKVVIGGARFQREEEETTNNNQYDQYLDSLIYHDDTPPETLVRSRDWGRPVSK